MVRASRSRLEIALAAAAILAFLLYCIVLIQVTCAGDLKSGAIGYPKLALEIEALSTWPGLVALLCGALFVYFRNKESTSQRIAVTIGMLAFGVVTLWVVGLLIETSGISMCIAP